MAEDFISEDDLNTFEGFLRFQAVDPATASADELAIFRKLFDEARRLEHLRKAWCHQIQASARASIVMRWPSSIMASCG